MSILRIIEIKNKEKLNRFVSNRKKSRFLQSWQWGEFQQKNGFKVFRLGAEDNGELKAVATLIKKKLPFGNYFYCPWGPIFEDVNAFYFLFDEIAKLAEKEKIMFLRFEPGQDIGDKKPEIKRSLDIQPSKTIILDLTKSEEYLLGRMHQKTRYNIRLAEKRGVKIRDGNLGEFEKFWELLGKTGKRDGFRLHSMDYYKKMLEINNQYIKLFFGEFSGKIICAGIFSFFADTVTYMHGASSDENRNTMASYLLHWHVIARAKSQGFEYYDFFGINEKKWPGLTRFKKGFGGKEINYPGTFDMAFNKTLYLIYKLGRKARRLF